MAHLTPDQFSTKWIPLLANNEFQNIDGPRLALLITDIKDSFETAAASVNVPDWLKGTYYPLDYLILHRFGGPAIFLQAQQAGYLPVPTDPLGDANWAPALGPVVAGTFQVGTVPALQGLRGDWVPGRLYILLNRLDAQGDPLPDVYVRALSASELEPEAYTIDALATPPEPVRVQYDLTTDITQPAKLAAFLPGTYTVQPADLPAPKITVPNAALFGNIDLEGATGSLTPLVYGSSYTTSGNVLTILAAANVQAGEVVHYSYLAGGVAAGYNDAQARAAQLGRVAPTNTTTVLLTAESPTDYGTASSGTFTVDATGCVVGKEAYFDVGVGGSVPLFTNAPQGQDFDTTLAKYISGAFNRYAVRVFSNRIEVIRTK